MIEAAKAFEQALRHNRISQKRCRTPIICDNTTWSISKQGLLPSPHKVQVWTRRMFDDIRERWRSFFLPPDQPHLAECRPFARAAVRRPILESKAVHNERATAQLWSACCYEWRHHAGCLVSGLLLVTCGDCGRSAMCREVARHARLPLDSGLPQAYPTRCASAPLSLVEPCGHFHGVAGTFTHIHTCTRSFSMGFRQNEDARVDEPSARSRKARVAGLPMLQQNKCCSTGLPIPRVCVCMRDTHE